jgi:aminoglycoside phosphotransferase (APT) family kinase protein
MLNLNQRFKHPAPHVASRAQAGGLYGAWVAVSPQPGPEEVSAALRRWLAGRFPGDVADAGAPASIGGGADFWVYGLHFGGPGLPAQWAVPLVARIPALPERFVLLERESRLQAWVAAQGYPAPPVLELVPPGELFESPVQVMERLPGTTMAEAMRAAPWRIPRLAGQLAASQAALHHVPVPGWALSGHGWSLADNRLRLARYLAGHGQPAGLAQALERAEPILPLLEIPEPVICHGDFQPANLLLLKAGKVSVIDWTSAGTGDRHGDIAWTAWLPSFAAVAAPHRGQRLVLRALAPVLSRAYLSAYRRDLPIDPARLRLWMPLQLLHVWAMAIADEQELFRPGRHFRAGLAAWARQQFWGHADNLP